MYDPDNAPAAKKHPQFILALAGSFFSFAPQHFPVGVPLVRLAARDFLEWPETMSALTIRERHHLEQDANYRQILPYVLVRQMDRDGVVRYLTYRRGSGVGEERLAQKLSIGIGGHIDAEDLLYQSEESVGGGNASVINLEGTILRSVARELEEELNINYGSLLYNRHQRATPPSFADRFIADYNGVNLFHLGVIMHLDLPVGATVKMGEDELSTIGMLTKGELLSKHNELESWSQIIVDHLG